MKTKDITKFRNRIKGIRCKMKTAFDEDSIINEIIEDLFEFGYIEGGKMKKKLILEQVRNS